MTILIDATLPMTDGGSTTAGSSVRKDNPGAAGMYLAMAATLALISMIQSYDGKLVNLGVDVSETQLSQANAVLAQMSGGPNSIESQIQAEVNSGDDATTKANKLAPLTAQMTVLNNQYSQINSAFGSIANGINQSASDTSQTESLGYELIQQGLGTLFQTLTQIF